MTNLSPRLRHRPSRTTPATIAAIVLLALGVLSILVGVLRLINGAWPSPALSFGNFLTTTTWGSTSWLLICIALGILGLIMIIAALKPGGMSAARLAVDPADAATGQRAAGPNESGGAPETEVVISRRGIARLAAARAQLVDGVDSVSVNAAAKRVRLEVDTSSQHTAEIEGEVTDTVMNALSELRLTPMPRVSATARTKEA